MFKITTRKEKIDWLKKRRLSIGSSDIPVIMGVSPYKTIEQLIAEKTSTEEPELSMNWAALNGIIEEPYVRDEYEEISGLLYPPKSFQKDRFTCSLDGYNDLTNTAIEIKYAAKKDHESGKIPEKYIYQIYWQYMISGASVIRYVSRRYGSVGEPLSIIVVPCPSEEIQNEIYANVNNVLTHIVNRSIAQQ